MTLNIDLTPEQESALAAKAEERRVPISDYVRGMVQEGVTPRPPHMAEMQYDREALLTLLDELESTDRYGTAEEQRQVLEHLETAVDADRQGQRRVYGKGYNPK